MSSFAFATLFSRSHRFVLAGLLGLGLGLGATAQAKQPVDPNGSPTDFVQAVGNNALEAIKHESSLKNGDIAKVNQIVNEYVLPYVDLKKTTRLSAGRYCRQATPKQQNELVAALDRKSTRMKS